MKEETSIPRKRVFIRVLRWAGFVLLVLVVALLLFFFVGPEIPAPHIAWGVNFSAMQAEGLKLDPREVYNALVEDLHAPRIKILADWDRLEPSRGTFAFNELDQEVAEATSHGTKLVVVLGMKTGRWPECHIPGWATGLSEADQQAEVMKLLDAAVPHYATASAIIAWQVENEALFPFGTCPWSDQAFLAREIAETKRLDPTRPVVVTDSGEDSLWFTAARLGDIVGTTLYRTVWLSQLHLYLTYPLPPTYYGRKAWLEELLFGKPVWNVELQAEPWGPTLLYDSPLSEQRKSFDLPRFRSTVEYARRTGLDTFYLWGGEWWYWMKVKQNDPSFWEEARQLFQSSI